MAIKKSDIIRWLNNPGAPQLMWITHTHLKTVYEAVLTHLPGDDVETTAVDLEEFFLNSFKFFLRPSPAVREALTKTNIDKELMDLARGEARMLNSYRITLSSYSEYLRRKQNTDEFQDFLLQFGKSPHDNLTRFIHEKPGYASWQTDLQQLAGRAPEEKKLPAPAAAVAPQPEAQPFVHRPVVDHKSVVDRKSNAASLSLNPDRKDPVPLRPEVKRQNNSESKMQLSPEAKKRSAKNAALLADEKWLYSTNPATYFATKTQSIEKEVKAGFYNFNYEGRSYTALLDPEYEKSAKKALDLQIEFFEEKTSPSARRR